MYRVEKRSVLKQITDDLAIDLIKYLRSKPASQECRKLLQRIEGHPDMKRFERLWIMVFRSTEIRPEHAMMKEAIASMSNNECETFLTGEYGNKKLGICIMFRCSLSRKQIAEQLDDFIHGRWDTYLLAAIPSAWIGKGTTQLNRWLNNI